MIGGQDRQLQHDPALDMIQAGDHWHPDPVAFSLTPPYHAPALPFLQHQQQHSCYGVADPSELIDLLRQLPVTELEADASLADSSTAATGCFADHRPRKASKRSRASGVCGGEAAGEALARREDEGAYTIALLFECAVAISAENLVEANQILHQLTHAASPYSASCAERVVAYFAKAMASRVVNSWTGICSPLIPNSTTISSAFEVFNSVSPFVRFAHFTANQVILEAVHRKERIHIVDLDIMQGLQWPALLHILATRPGGPPQVRMTGFGATAEAAGKRVSDFARRLGMPFEFRPIAKRPGEVHPSTVARGEGEDLAVHWLRHGLYDAAGCEANAMRLVETLRPKVATLVEQEVAHAGGFLDRFVGALRYYCVMFDSLGASLAADDASRHGVEHGVLSREIDGILGVGGPGRSGEEKFESWRRELVRRGFSQVAMSRNVMAQAQLILSSFPSSTGYTVHHGSGNWTVKVGWKDTPLYTASAWTAEQLS